MKQAQKIDLGLRIGVSGAKFRCAPFLFQKKHEKWMNKVQITQNPEFEIKKMSKNSKFKKNKTNGQ